MTFTQALTRLGTATVESAAVERRADHLGYHASDVLRASEKLEGVGVPDLPGGRLTSAWGSAREHALAVCTSHAQSVHGTASSIRSYVHASTDEDLATARILGGHDVHGLSTGHGAPR